MKIWIGNFRGPEGKQGEKGRDGDRGATGAAGQRGSRWTSGTGITGTATVGTRFPGSGITDAQVHDCYINTTTGNLYECTVPGAADTAEWVHIGNFKGPAGDTGPAGSISDINNQKPTYVEAGTLAGMESGETVAAAFGKLKKALSLFMAHYAQKAAASVLGHVKLSDSPAITTAGEYALDAIEKNASKNGTLANAIGQLNSDLNNRGSFMEAWLTASVRIGPGSSKYPGNTDNIIPFNGSHNGSNGIFTLNDDGSVTCNKSGIVLAIAHIVDHPDTANLNIMYKIGANNALYNRQKRLGYRPPAAQQRAFSGTNIFKVAVGTTITLGAIVYSDTEGTIVVGETMNTRLSCIYL